MDATARSSAERGHPAGERAARDDPARQADDPVRDDPVREVAVREAARAGAAELRHRRVRLTREPAAAALARREVRTAIAAWDAGVDADIAVLLASDLVTNAIVRGEGATITLGMAITLGAQGAASRLRVEVHDTWRALPVVLDVGASTADASGADTSGADTSAPGGPGLALIATLADEWGTFRTPGGMAVYFALDCERAEGGTSQCHQGLRGNVGSMTVRGPSEEGRPGPRWVKSSLSYANGNCVEVASLPGGEIGVRNSRDSAGPVLTFTPGEWRAFLGGVRDREFGGFAS